VKRINLVFDREDKVCAVVQHCHRVVCACVRCVCVGACLLCVCVVLCVVCVCVCVVTSGDRGVSVLLHCSLRERC
jgi:hypothetical protein